jgi:hypothetical protein
MSAEEKLKLIDQLIEEKMTQRSEEQVNLSKKAKSNRKIREKYPTSGHCWVCNQPIIDEEVSS